MHTKYERLCKDICTDSTVFSLSMCVSLHNGSLNITLCQSFCHQSKSIAFETDRLYLVLLYPAEEEESPFLKRFKTVIQSIRAISESIPLRISVRPVSMITRFSSQSLLNIAHCFQKVPQECRRCS